MSTLYVCNIPYTAEESHLRSLFEKCGTVSRIRIPLERDSGRRRGFAFVEMSSVEEGRRAIRELDGADLGGRLISVTVSQDSSRS